MKHNDKEYHRKYNEAHKKAMRRYNKAWMWNSRHSEVKRIVEPIVPLKEHVRKSSREPVEEYVDIDRCIHCRILLSKVKNHNCLSPIQIYAEDIV